MIASMIKPWFSVRRLIALLLGASALLLVVCLPALFRTESALQIRASRQGISLPDGFYVYQRLSAQGIKIKSITPENNALVIKFDSQEQSVAAEKVLHALLPEGFDIARMNDTRSHQWISHIRPSSQNIS